MKFRSSFGMASLFLELASHSAITPVGSYSCSCRTEMFSGDQYVGFRGVGAALGTSGLWTEVTATGFPLLCSGPEESDVPVLPHGRLGLSCWFLTWELSPQNCAGMALSLPALWLLSLCSMPTPLPRILKPVLKLDTMQLIRIYLSQITITVEFCFLEMMLWSPWLEFWVFPVPSATHLPLSGYFQMA